MGEISYRPLIEDMIWSYSRLNCFEHCPYRWFLKYIKKLPEAPGFYASYGSFMHKLIERFLTGNLSQDDAVTEFLLNFSTEVKGLRPKDSTVKSYIEKGVSYLKTIRPFPYKMLGVEKKTGFKADGIPFIGYIDYLGENEKGGLVIIDNKSRDLKPRSGKDPPSAKDAELDDMLKQLYIYAESIKEEYGRYPEKLCFNCFKTGAFIEEKFDEIACKNALLWAKKLISDITETEDFYPRADYFGCSFICGYKDECCYAEGSF